MWHYFYFGLLCGVGDLQVGCHDVAFLSSRARFTQLWIVTFLNTVIVDMEGQATCENIYCEKSSVLWHLNFM